MDRLWQPPSRKMTDAERARPLRYLQDNERPSYVYRGRYAEVPQNAHEITRDEYLRVKRENYEEGTHAVLIYVKAATLDALKAEARPVGITHQRYAARLLDEIFRREREREQARE